MLTEYEVAAIVVAMLTTAIAIGAPIIKLNTVITKLIVKLDSLGANMEQLEAHNREGHRRIWDKNDEQDEKIADHESRLRIIEKEG